MRRGGYRCGYGSCWVVLRQCEYLVCLDSRKAVACRIWEGGGNCEIGDENVNDTVVSRELAESEGLFQDPACCASENECKCFLVSGGNL